MCEECIKDMVAEGMDPELVSETVELFLNDQEAYEREHEHDSEFVDPYDAEGNETWPEYDYEDEDY